VNNGVPRGKGQKSKPAGGDPKQKRRRAKQDRGKPENKSDVAAKKRGNKKENHEKNRVQRQCSKRTQNTVVRFKKFMGVESCSSNIGVRRHCKKAAKVLPAAGGSHQGGRARFDLRTTSPQKRKILIPFHRREFLYLLNQLG